eukprot:CAMPEP_0114351514 /NCGR_PEP_ID=MMETSP0101-20121206/17250_1 /TAXON_ID=38822 ORGANISM="Pteridomonas danica, Strain PT" /NCGR_SAMPLE_ID=MMETSP0101 /ASSEMBLY_ACC=CAM_ASM_000211 /LENGTH=171 /DNA_ID=CAMNT_0001491447 /DNA_START=159 /DNA_END=674 /DNA_ORIENTATION=-
MEAERQKKNQRQTKPKPKSNQPDNYIPLPTSKEDNIFDSALNDWMKSHQLIVPLKKTTHEKLKHDSSQIVALSLNRKPEKLKKKKKDRKQQQHRESHDVNDSLLDILPSPPQIDKALSKKEERQQSRVNSKQNEKDMLQLPIDKLKRLQVQLDVIQNSGRRETSTTSDCTH